MLPGIQQPRFTVISTKAGQLPIGKPLIWLIWQSSVGFPPERICPKALRNTEYGARSFMNHFRLFQGLGLSLKGLLSSVASGGAVKK